MSAGPSFQDFVELMLKPPAQLEKQLQAGALERFARRGDSATRGVPDL